MLIFSFFFFLCVLGENSTSDRVQDEDIELFQFFRAHVPFKTKREKKNSRHACKTSVPLIVPVRTLFYVEYFNLFDELRAASGISKVAKQSLYAEVRAKSHGRS